MSAHRSTEQVDSDLLTARDMYLQMVERDNFDGAALAHRRLDALLDERLHLPQQRTAVHDQHQPGPAQDR